MKRPWHWERLRAGGEGNDRGWDGWMASPTQWTWVWVDSRSWWWTRRPGMLRFMGLQRVRRDGALNWTDAGKILLEIKIVQFVNRIIKIKKRKMLLDVINICLLSDQEKLNISCIGITYSKFMYSNTLATWCEETTHWKSPWCWERLKAKRKEVTEDEIIR